MQAVSLEPTLTTSLRITDARLSTCLVPAHPRSSVATVLSWHARNLMARCS